MRGTADSRSDSRRCPPALMAAAPLAAWSDTAWVGSRRREGRREGIERSRMAPLAAGCGGGRSGGSAGGGRSRGWRCCPADPASARTGSTASVGRLGALRRLAGAPAFERGAASGLAGCCRRPKRSRIGRGLCKRALCVGQPTAEGARPGAGRRLVVLDPQMTPCSTRQRRLRGEAPHRRNRAQQDSTPNGCTTMSSAQCPFAACSTQPTTRLRRAAGARGSSPPSAGCPAPAPRHPGPRHSARRAAHCDRHCPTPATVLQAAEAQRLAHSQLLGALQRPLPGRVRARGRRPCRSGSLDRPPAAAATAQTNLTHSPAQERPRRCGAAGP